MCSLTAASQWVDLETRILVGRGGGRFCFQNARNEHMALLLGVGACNSRLVGIEAGAWAILQAQQWALSEKANPTLPRAAGQSIPMVQGYV